MYFMCSYIIKSDLKKFQLLQPACLPKDDEDRMFLPCRSYCREFWSGCGGRIPERFKDLMDCSRLPEYTGPKSCRPKPGKYMQNVLLVKIISECLQPTEYVMYGKDHNIFI